MKKENLNEIQKEILSKDERYTRLSLNKNILTKYYREAYERLVPEDTKKYLSYNDSHRFDEMKKYCQEYEAKLESTTLTAKERRQLEKVDAKYFNYKRCLDAKAMYEDLIKKLDVKSLTALKNEMKTIEERAMQQAIAQYEESGRE